MSWTEQCSRWSIAYAYTIWAGGKPPRYYGRGAWLETCEAYAYWLGLPVFPPKETPNA